MPFKAIMPVPCEPMFLSTVGTDRSEEQSLFESEKNAEIDFEPFYLLPFLLKYSA